MNFFIHISYLYIYIFVIVVCNRLRPSRQSMLTGLENLSTMRWLILDEEEKGYSCTAWQ